MPQPQSWLSPPKYLPQLRKPIFLSTAGWKHSALLRFACSAGCIVSYTIDHFTLKISKTLSLVAFRTESSLTRGLTAFVRTLEQAAGIASLGYLVEVEPYHAAGI